LPGIKEVSDYMQWCIEDVSEAFDLQAFGKQFSMACGRADIRTKKMGSRMVCVRVRLKAAKAPQRAALGHMHKSVSA